MTRNVTTPPFPTMQQVMRSMFPSSKIPQAMDEMTLRARPLSRRAVLRRVIVCFCRAAASDHVVC